MALFRRKRATADEATPEAPEGSVSSQTDAQPAPADAPAGGGAAATDATSGAAKTGETSETGEEAELGPFDASTLTTRAGLVDLGAILLPGIRGLVVSMELDQASGDVTAVRVHLGNSQLQLQAFAAPKSTGIWDEIRGEIAEALTAQGGSSTTEVGPFGTELIVRVPGLGADGRPVTNAMRFVGIDRPRWFLRGVISGPAATDAEAARPFVDLLHVTIVDRGHEPMAPRELLPLRLPPEPVAPEATPEAGPAVPLDQAQQGQQPAEHSTDDLRPFERGPEITEVR
ncbi:hypothetical protein BJY21_000142 [Kineosphaera limosa]|uniref:DUF3710 domain-containing protein n=1 Tax=Kineosphaera limosa NBRC 100340 TaxID=1184609 RepID=K6X0G4_9MICO|nr:DUF3710 domain-containing protein [Kineosphaera limosa]NYD98957.1 hypothetical protein [Kineosphaera limosa]GAB97822.1 hypothetical protein KILIM_083_00180 [Kineosphaera limosa NBRC 100340]